jgi:hypothetical protein
VRCVFKNAFQCLLQMFPICGPPGPAVGPLVGELFVWGIYLFWTKYGQKINNIFCRNLAWLKYFTCQLVTVLAPNYKQHSLWPAEARTVCYSLSELYVRCLVDFIRMEGGMKFMEHFKGGASYESLGTTVLLLTDLKLPWKQYKPN